MKQLFISLSVIFVFTLTANTQNTDFSQNFEKLEKGKDITKLKKGKFSAWGDAVFTVSEKKEKEMSIFKNWMSFIPTSVESLRGLPRP